MRNVAVFPACFAVSLFLLPVAPAMAFNPAGGQASAIILMSLGSFTLLNLIFQLLFYFTGPYSQAGVARIHAGLGMLFPLAALMFALKEHAGSADLIFKLGAIFIAAAFALLPLALQHSARPLSSHSALYLALAAVCLTLPTLYLAPFGLFSASLAAVALRYAKTLATRLWALLALIPSATLLLYWLIQISGKLMAQ